MEQYLFMRALLVLSYYLITILVSCSYSSSRLSIHIVSFFICQNPNIIFVTLQEDGGGGGLDHEGGMALK